MKKIDALRFFGGRPKNLMDAINQTQWKITSGAMAQWGEEVPPGRAYQIQVLSGGQLKADGPESRT